MTAERFTEGGSVDLAGDAVLAVVQRKPGALRNGAPFAEFYKFFSQLQGQMLRRPGRNREIVDVPALVLRHDEQAVLIAVAMAPRCSTFVAAGRRWVLFV